jgi:hypothetical protein
MKTRGATGSQRLESDAASSSYSVFAAVFVCDEPATARDRIQAISARDGLPVAVASSKQVNMPKASAGAAADGLFTGSDGWAYR